MAHSGSLPPTFKIPHLVLTTHGTWLADGEEITHERTRQLLFRSIFRQEPHQDLVIRVGKEQLPFTAEDTAYFILAISGSPEAGFEVKTSEGEWVALDPRTLKYQTSDPSHRLICTILTHNDGRSEEARFLSAPYHALLMHCEESHAPGSNTEIRYHLMIQGKEFVLG